MTYDWAAYKRHERAHHKGEHENCNYAKCPDRRAIEDTCELHPYVIALFAELERQHIDALTFFGERLDSMRDLAGMQFPEWCDTEPDFLHKLWAKADVLGGRPRI
jgi:hypothetical protein